MRDSGGKEKDYELQSKSMPESTVKRKQNKGGMATIERDADGNIISVEEAEITRADTAWGPALNSDDEDAEAVGEGEEDEDDEEDDEGGVGQGGEDLSKSGTDVIQCEFYAASFPPIEKARAQTSPPLQP